MTDYSNYHDPYHHPYEYAVKDLQPDIRDADALTWHQKRIAQTIRDQLLLDEGLALARVVLLYHERYKAITDKMSVAEHMRFDKHLLEAGFALQAMADAWWDHETKDDEE